MDTTSVWALLSNLKVGSVVAWIFVIIAIITAICGGTIKLYKVFTKYKKLKDEDERQKNLLSEHEAVLKEIRESVNLIRDNMEQQKEVDLKVIRHLMTFACEEALSCGYISENKMKSLEEMYEEYTNVFHGNGYVKGLMIRVRQLVCTK